MATQIYTPRIERNEFEDTIVMFPETSRKYANAKRLLLVKLLKEKKDVSLIVRGKGRSNEEFISKERVYLLGTHPHQGEIWGNAFAYQRWPRVENSIIHGACGCILLQHEDRNFAVLVQSKRSAELTLPGGLCDLNESFQGAAIREIKEETGLEVSGLSFLVDWSYLGPYVSLMWRHLKRVFWVQGVLPPHWVAQFEKNPIQSHQLIRLDPKLCGATDDEIEYVYLLSCDHIERYGSHKLNFRHYEALKMGVKRMSM